jgi:hypothetical protein
MRNLLSIAILLLLAVAAPAQRRHDPLNSVEQDQMREVAQDPDKRLKLLIKFAKARLLAVEQLRGDPKLAEGRGKQVHNLLEDFNSLVEELGDNIDMYAREKQDMRKGLKEVIEADSEWQVKLRSLKAENDPKLAAERKDYDFVLQSAIDTVNESADNSRAELQDEIAAIEAAKHKK